MFERLSERALRVLFFARDEASQLGSMSIDTEHLVLGLIREPKGLTSRLFADAGIALDDIRAEVLRRVPARPRTSTSADIPFSAAATRLTGGRPISPLTTLVAATSFAMSTPVAMPMPSSI